MRYIYIGPVLQFGKCIANDWRAATFATSIQKAKSNLMHQYKTTNGLAPDASIELPNKLRVDYSEGWDFNNARRKKD